MHCERASPKRAVLACRPGVAVGDGGAIDRANKAWHVLRNRACLQINAMGIKLSAVAVKVDQPPCDRPGRSSAVAARARELRLSKPWQALGRAEVSAKAMRRDLGATRHHAPSCWQTAPGETLLAASSLVLADARPGKFGYGEANTRGRGPGQPRWPPPI